MLDAIKEALLGCEPPDHKAGLFIYDLIKLYDLTQTLEVGASHKATCIYCSAGHLEKGYGTHLILDYDSPADRVLAIRSAAKKLGSEPHCSFDLSPVSLHWRLMKLLAEAPMHNFDLCFLVGRQTWSHSGFAALLALRLLRPGGWLVLGDAGYTYANDSGAPEYLTAGMSEEEKSAPQVDFVFAQLVANDSMMRHPVRVGKLFAAQKCLDSENSERVTVPMKAAAAIDTAFRRAVFDPDFRRALIESPGEVLKMLTGVVYQPAFSKIHFHDRPATKFVLPWERREELHMILPEPVWQATISEQELENLVQVAEERYHRKQIEVP
jgi:hypothetical protein